MAKQKLRDLPRLFQSQKARGKAKRVWGEYEAGSLHHGGSGEVVRDPSVARAIMFSEAERAKNRTRKGYKAKG